MDWAQQPINQSGHKRVLWDRQPLGEMSDVALARQLGLTSAAVRKARLKRGIRTYHKNRWRHVGLGTFSDKDLAQKLGVSRRTISRTRRQHGLHGPQTIDWDKQPLGQLPDTELGRRLGVSQTAVSSARRIREIPTAHHQWLTLEGESATWPEALIDLYWHENQVDHEFQFKVGPYVCDWKIDNDFLVEYAGFGSHRKHGEKYLDRLQKKIGFYQNQGWSTLVIWPKNLGQYDLGLSPQPRHLISCGQCQSTFGVDRTLSGKPLKHKAKGLCRSCYRKGKPCAA